jgi:DNA-binding SARP family transcriptional activator
MKSKVTYRQQYTRCGKQRCRKCREGLGHGPYWYAYWSENGRTVSKYIGAQLPPEVEQQRQQLPSLPRRAWRSPSRSERRSARADARPLLRIYLLGQFRVERRSGNAWLEDDSRSWQRRRARALLGCLLCHPLRRMGREQAMEALWPDPDVDSETAANRLNGAVHELRRLLEPGIRRPARSSLLRLQHDVLELADGSIIWVDADAFEEKLNRANTLADPQLVEQLLEEAASLYRGDYLVEELYAEWAQPRRESLRRRWMGLLLQLAELRAARGALAAAIEPLDRLLMSDPTHETAVRQLMLILTRLDRRGEALQAYQRLREVLEREYSSEPLPETRRLYEALRRGEVEPALAAPFSPASAGQLEDEALADDLRQDDPASWQDGSRAPLTAGSDRLARRSGENEPSLRPHFPSGRRKQTPLIGRERELALMREWLLSLHTSERESAALRPARAAGEQQALVDSPLGGVHFLLLTGEAGIGKTRLAEELGYEAGRQGWQVAWSRSYEQEAAIPYCPWIELLRTLLHSYLARRGTARARDLTQLGLSGSHRLRLAALLPELDERLPSLHVPSTLPAEQERLHLWEAALSLLTALAREGPLLLVLDDLHWADESSLDLLGYLARHLRDQPIRLLGTCRQPELMSAHGLRALINDLLREEVLLSLPVEPLTTRQIAQLVAHLPARVVQSIQLQAAGNPFFAEELARYLERENGEGSHSWQGAASEARLPLPETIAAVLDRRLSKLSTACQTLLSKAAVFGAPFEFNHLLFMDAGQLPHPQEDHVLDLLEEALRAGLLIEEGHGSHVSYHFWHPLIESHLYQSLSVARRMLLHRRAAEALLTLHPQRTHEVAAAVTYHLIRGAGDSLLIARYAEIAANRAYLLAAYGEAQYYYRLALLALAGIVPPASEERRPFVSLDGFSLAQAPATGDAATLPLDRLDLPLPIAAGQELLHFARLLEHVGECCMIQGNYAEARRLYERVIALRSRALELLERQEQRDSAKLAEYRRHEAQIQALIWREISLAWLRNGDFARARECLERGKQRLSEAGAGDALAGACLLLQEGNLYALEGDYSQGWRCVQQMLQILERAQAEQLPPTRVEQQAEEPLTLSERASAGDPLELGRAHETLGVIAARLGRPGEALAHLHTALEIYERHDCVMAMAQICGNLGAAHALVADHQAARSYMRRALELTERTGDLPNMAFVTGNLGEMARRCGDLGEAEACFRRSLALVERTQEREHMAWCNIALAETLQSAGKLSEALRCIHLSLLTGRRIRHARTIAHALIVLAEIRLAQASALRLAYARQLEVARRTPGQDCRACRLYHLWLQRGAQGLTRALACEGLDAEIALQGKLLQAQIAFLSDQLEQAYEATAALISEATRQENRLALGHAHRLLGRILAARHRPQSAAVHFEQAAHIFRDGEMLLEYARTLHSYGAHLLLSSSGAEPDKRAEAYLGEARALFERAGAIIDLQWARVLLASQQDAQLIATALRAMP